MSKIDTNDLIMFQRGELGEERRDLIENELKSNEKLKKELEVLTRADMAMENHFSDFQMPKDFQKEVKKKFRKEFKLFSFFNPKMTLSYSGGIATACFIFALFLSINENKIDTEESFFTSASSRFNFQKEENNILSKKWDVTKDLVVNTKINNKDFYFTLIPFDDKIVQIEWHKDNQIIPIYKDLFLKKGILFKSKNIFLNSSVNKIIIIENFTTIYSKQID